MTNGPYYEMKKKPEVRLLDTDRLQRVSYLVGIFKALNILHGRELADEWSGSPTQTVFSTALRLSTT